MPRLYRPSIPDSVKVAVAERQLREEGLAPARKDGQTLKDYLAHLLVGLTFDLDCDLKDLRLDHNPALGTRMKRTVLHHVKGRPPKTITIYSPAANDPAHLIYRTHQDHLIKTHVRGDGAQYSDTVLMKRERRRQKVDSGKPPKRPKQKIAARKNSWPTGRKIPTSKR